MGSPTVILESGAGMSSNEWERVQPEIMKFTRVCSYDRSGYGWSEASVGPATDTVQVLRTLLNGAEVSGPYVLVGHSYGSSLVRRFAHRFSGDVVGIVLTATSYPDEELRRITDETGERYPRFVQTYFWMTRSGLIRIIPEQYLPAMFQSYVSLLRKYLPPEAAQSEISFLHQTRHARSLFLEAQHPNSAEEAEDIAACERGFGTVPLVVLAERWDYSTTPDAREREEAQHEDDRQTRLAHLSVRGKKIDVDSGHLIPLERPVSVIEAVRGVVTAARQQ
jgi:pimeloyl-ACP methyl ester carboxylesterase